MWHIYRQHLLYDITTELGEAKRDPHTAAYRYGGVVLQPLQFEFMKVCMGKNSNPHYSWNFDILALKMTHLNGNTLLSFLLPCRFSAWTEAF